MLVRLGVGSGSFLSVVDWANWVVEGYSLPSMVGKAN